MRLALRYDMTVPLARVMAAHGGQLPTPYKRYAIGPVWRADRPGRGRYREFTQCDVDILGSTSPLADADLAELMNWMFWRFDKEHLPVDFQPFTAPEIGRLRTQPLRLEASQLRTDLLKKADEIAAP